MEHKNRNGVVTYWCNVSTGNGIMIADREAELGLMEELNWKKN